MLAAELFIPSLSTISTEFGKARSDGPSLISSYFMGSLLGLAMCFILPRFLGLKRTFITLTLLFLGATLFFSFVESWTAAVFWRFVMGMASGTGTALCYAVISRMDTAGRMERNLLVFNACAYSTLAIAPAIGVAFETTIGWRSAALFLAGIIAVQLVLSMRLGAETREVPDGDDPSESSNGHRRVLPILLSSGMLFASIFLIYPISPMIITDLIGLDARYYAIFGFVSISGVILGATVGSRKSWHLRQLIVATVILIVLATCGLFLLFETRVADFVGLFLFCGFVFIFNVAEGIYLAFAPKLLLEHANSAAAPVLSTALSGSYLLGSTIGSHFSSIEITHRFLVGFVAVFVGSVLLLLPATGREVDGVGRPQD